MIKYLQQLVAVIKMKLVTGLVTTDACVIDAVLIGYKKPISKSSLK